MVRAVVLASIGEPMRVEEIDLPEPGPGMVRVRLAAAGVCHSDLSLAGGVLRQPVPAVLGHEGAGTVTAVGDGVTSVAVGDDVVLNWSPSCGTCHFCTIGEPYLCLHSGDATTVPYATFHGEPLYAGLGTAAFAEETVVPEGGVLPLPDGVPLIEAALLGCAVLTGFGAVTHAAQVQPGESVVVYGLGGVGLATIQAARIAGATTIIAVDVRDDKGVARAGAGRDAFPAGRRRHREDDPGPDRRIRRGSRVRVRRAGGHDPDRVVVHPARRQHHGGRHRRRPGQGRVLRAGAVPLRPYAARLRVRQRRRRVPTCRSSPTT